MASFPILSATSEPSHTPPLSRSKALTEEPNQGLRPLKRNAEKKFCSRSPRLNSIITDLFLIIWLTWVDLFFNDISHIDPHLYLSEVDKLGATLTLHGNTMENEGCYRGYVIAALPHLKMLDFCAVTHQERIMAQVWHRPSNHSENTRKNQNNLPVTTETVGGGTQSSCQPTKEFQNHRHTSEDHYD
ncbi:unnamed protein product [Coregonus sp. 'balchen']|nr:unnamed protein product [Coregonus sp. 'balchen']